MRLDASSEAWLARLLTDPPPLSQQQQDLIAACFAGALRMTKKVPRRENDGGPERSRCQGASPESVARPADRGRR